LEALLTDDTVYTVIVYTHPIRKENLTVLETYAQKHKTPLVAIHSAGFYSYFQIHLPGAFPIVETHPDETATTDLRLLKPWPELVAFAQELTRDIDNQDDFEHGHIPYVAILLHYLEQWRETHDGRYPTTYKEKTEFRSIVQRAARTNNPEGGEENFDEAAAAVLKTLVVPSLPSGLKRVFEYKHADPVGHFPQVCEPIFIVTCEDQVEQRSGFWIIADAVKAFFEKHQCLPLPGKLPDMKAQSKIYVQLQNLYKEKARKDAAEVLETVRAMPGGQDIDPAEVELFCKNAAFVRLINATDGGNEQDSKLERLRSTAGKPHPSLLPLRSCPRDSLFPSS